MTEFVLFIIDLVSVMTVLLLLFNAGKSFLGGLLGQKIFLSGQVYRIPGRQNFTDAPALVQEGITSSGAPLPHEPL